jgi:hypothetical protein
VTLREENRPMWQKMSRGRNILSTGAFDAMSAAPTARGPSVHVINSRHDEVAGTDIDLVVCK